jgi:signal transduction histidine kinase/ActR/RegA family two-component response regulator
MHLQLINRTIFPSHRVNLAKGRQATRWDTKSKMNEPQIGIGRVSQSLPGRILFHLPELSALVLLVAVGALGWIIWEYRRTVDLVQHTFEVQTSLLAVLSLDHAAELSSRSYIFTGEEFHLQRNRTTVNNIEVEMAHLQNLTANNPEQQIKFVRLKSDLEIHLATLERGIDLRRTAGIEAALSFVQGGSSFAAREQVGADIAEMVEAQHNLHLSRLVDVERVTVAGAIVASLALLLVIGSMAAWIWGTRREARALLATIAERERNETKIRQMQKMEAVGQLTGGLAHDLNNMLAVIISGLNLIQKRLAAGDTNIMQFVSAAMDGATRAATLTNRLTAFSRQQPLSPKPIGVNRLMVGMSELVQRTLGETIQTETVLNAGLWSINADAGQLENALLNLSINARDAMPDGGKLTIETSNCQIDDIYAHQYDIPAGEYVLIAVTDTGTGMTEDVASKAFDPFFTTKDVGKGTGLGLSQVYGFIKQSGGHTKIYSEPGHGTTIKMYLPRLRDAGPEKTIEAAKEETLPDMRKENAGKIILVVEDDARVREMTTASVRELGYTVIHADGAKSALEKLDAHPETTMLFTDIVMPDINGQQLATEALLRQPNIKVLYTSGFARGAIVHGGEMDAGRHFIAKPFTLAQVAAKISAVLSGRAAA